MTQARAVKDRGYAMAALLVAMGVMSIMASAAMPVWRTAVQREREAELVFRGEQYVQAIDLFSRQTGGFPTSLNMLRDGRYIRRLYTDPITGEDFQPVYLGQVAAGAVGAPGGRGAPGGGRGGAGQPAMGRAAGAPMVTGRIGQAPFGGLAGAQGAGPIIGVVSRSTDESIRQYNGRGRYNEWLFVSTAATRQAGAPTGAQTPGPDGRGGRQLGPGPPGRGGPFRGFPGRGRMMPPGRRGGQ